MTCIGRARHSVRTAGRYHIPNGAHGVTRPTFILAFPTVFD